MSSFFSDPTLMLATVVAIAVLATFYTIFAPMLESNEVEKRMKSVALERDKLRAASRAMMQSEVVSSSKKGLRRENNKSVRQLVEQLNLREALVDGATTNKLSIAGYRSPTALNTFLLARFGLPFIFFAAALFWVFYLGGLSDKSTMVRLFICIAVGYFGFYLPVIIVSNQANKRQASIKTAWPDALDLMLICVESGITVEAAFQKVAVEIANQSPALAEEMILTTAELSYLEVRRDAFENLAKRTGLDTVRSVAQALIQAEKYGTPVAQALRVLAQESRDERLNNAEKKAAALPPKLTVPMILFFLPVLFGVILGPAIMNVMDNF